MRINVKCMYACAFLAATAALPANAEGKIKNIILMIGDGMGPQQMGLFESYVRLAPNSIYKGRQSAMSILADEGEVGLAMTYSFDSIVSDSANAATQIAIGELAPLLAIGVDFDGNPRETVSELAARLGKATGLVSDTRITHATPASFGAHQPLRSFENEIAADFLKSGIDVMLSGGLRHFIPGSSNEKGETYEKLRALTGGNVGLKSKRKDERNLLEEAQGQGYQLAFNRAQMDSVTEGKVLGLFANSGMMDGIRYSASRDSADRTEPTLNEMTV